MTRSSAPTAARSPPSSGTSRKPACHLEVGSQTFEGGPGNDVVYGDRGNDTLRGNAGNDRLYGGIGDDVLEGGEGDDLLSGDVPAPTSSIDGQAGNDYVRGDATVDHIFDTGGGFDTLSFATGATPGFTARIESDRRGELPPPVDRPERGVWLKLNEGGNNAIDGEPSLGPVATTKSSRGYSSGSSARRSPTTSSAARRARIISGAAAAPT